MTTTTLPAWIQPKMLHAESVGSTVWWVRCHKCDDDWSRFYAQGSRTHCEDEAAQHVQASHRSEP